MKRCNNHLKLLNNLKEILQKGKGSMDGHKCTRLNLNLIWVILRKVGPTFFKIMTNRPDKGRFFSQNHFVCNVTIILSVKEFHITIFEF